MAKLIIWQCYDPLVRISEGNVIFMSLVSQHDLSPNVFFKYLIITKMMVINGNTLSIHSSA